MVNFTSKMLSLFPNENKQEAKYKTLQVIFLTKNFFHLCKKHQRLFSPKYFQFQIYCEYLFIIKLLRII